MNTTRVDVPSRMLASLIVPLMFFVACAGEDSAREEGFSAWDSAGVAIAESTRPEWNDESGWSVSSTAELEIGGLDGPGETSFSGIRGVLLRPDGGVVVADRGATELRFFDLSGTLTSRAGRQGDGPGEFRAIAALHQYRGDSLAVWDDQRRSWTIMDSEGGFGRMVNPEIGSFNPRPVGPFADGSFLVADMELRSPAGTPGTATLDVDHYLRVTENGTFADSLGEFPNQRRYVPVQGVQALFGEIFGARGVASAVANGFWFGAGDSNETRFYTVSGKLTRIVRWAGVRVPVTDEDLSRYQAQRIERDGGSDPGLLAQALAGAPAASRFPVFESLIVDSDGRMWLGEFRRPMARAERAWTIFDAEGRWLGQVTLPQDFEVHKIEGSRLVGVARDDLGVEYVRVYSISGS